MKRSPATTRACFRLESSIFTRTPHERLQSPLRLSSVPGVRRLTGIKTEDHLDEAFLNGTYRALKTSGLKAGLFSIDDKWEGAYGNLEHSATRLPHFEQFLEQLRADGYRVGMWAALMRCERPVDIG